jgi:hypothetical protein
MAMTDAPSCMGYGSRSVALHTTLELRDVWCQQFLCS